MRRCTLLGGTDDHRPGVTRWLNWDVEHKRWEKEMHGLVRALSIGELRRARRPWQCHEDMTTDAEITSWMAWRSLRMRGYEPRDVGVYAISLRCVRQVMAGRAFRPLLARGDRSWADSLFNRRNNVRVRTNREVFELEGSTGDGHEESDVMADWLSFKKTLQEDDLRLVQALETGDVGTLGKVKGLKRRKRAPADGFRAFRAG